MSWPLPFTATLLSAALLVPTVSVSQNPQAKLAAYPELMGTTAAGKEQWLSSSADSEASSEKMLTPQKAPGDAVAWF